MGGKFKEEFRKQMYGGCLQKNLKNIFKRELVENFGFSDKLAIADLIVDRFMELYDLYAPPADRVKPGQMVWLAVDVDDLPGRNKTMAMTKLKPVILTVTDEHDLWRARKGEHPRRMLPDIIARIMMEAFDQGGVLSQYDVAVVTGRSLAYVGRAIKQWQEEHGKTLPSRGTIHDLGSSTTHKKEIVALYLQGYRTSEIARKTGHHPVNVDRYVKDFKRVLMLAKDGRDPYEIAFFTRMTETLVREYLSIIETNGLITFDPSNQGGEET